MKSLASPANAGLAFFCFGNEEKRVSFAWRGDSFGGYFGNFFEALFGLFGIAFGVIFKVLLRILLECSFVYLFMAPETWLPAPKAPGKKGCSQTEV